MDQALVTAQAVMLAGIFASIVQERFFDRFGGTTARVVSVIVALVIGILAVIQSGGFVLVSDGTVLSTAISLLANASVVLVASQAAFHVLVKPATK